MHSDLALVVSGGGMTCAYSAGVLLRLKLQPRWAIGSSGSTGTLAYNTSKQYRCFRNIWENLLSVKKFIDFKRMGRIIDIDYLIDEVFKKQDPLDIQAIRNSPTELLIATTNYKTGKVRYFSNKEDVDIFEVLRASNAMPIVYGKKIMIESQAYFDGALSASVGVNIKEAIKRGAETIIVIDNNTDKTGWKLINGAISLLLPRNVGAAMRKTVIDHVNFSSPGVKIIHVRPSKKLPVSMLDNNSERIRATIDMGFWDVANHPELAELI